MRQDQPLHQVRHQLCFLRGLFHKLTPHGRVEKKIAHGNGCSLGAGSGAYISDLAALVGNLHPAFAAAQAGQQGHFGDRGDGAERFPAEPQCRYAQQVFLRAQLAGGMALKGHAQLAFGDAGAIVADADELESAFSYIHGDGGRPRVQAVFDQLLDGGAGPLDDLAGRDMADDLGA
ncbi:hypothetical protein SDC9_163078 [bioreactor metagenome]|uniref:Uncharacterized protein n=1 Tax=bioreactor metagenome TaxID=1076179 RepID=A0A645FUF8_9ZZZZ